VLAASLAVLNPHAVLFAHCSFLAQRLLNLKESSVFVSTLLWPIVNFQGIDAGVLIQTALYKGDMATKNSSK
jgi:uncharacterized membrane protein